MIADRVRRYRRDRGLSVRQLAEECAALGAASLTAASLANIERGQTEDAKRPRRQVTAEELLALAYVLAVPPVMLLLPIGDDRTVEVVPGIAVHPDLAYQWVIGDEPPAVAEPGRGNVVASHVDMAFFHRVTVPLALYRELREAQKATARRWSRLQDMENRHVGDSAEVAEARRGYRDALRDHVAALRVMESVGLSTHGLIARRYYDDATAAGIEIPEGVAPYEPERGTDDG